jgi:hypothetical protein
MGGEVMRQRINKWVVTVGALVVLSGIAFAASGVPTSWIQARGTLSSNPCAVGKACLYPKTSDGKWHTVDTAGNDVAVGSGGGGGSGASQWDFQLWAAASPNTATSAGALTLSMEVAFMKASTIVGVKGYWAGGADTIKCSLWDAPATTRLKTGTVVVSGAGNYTCDFSSTQAAAADTGYWFSVYGQDGTEYTAVITTSFPALPTILPNSYGTPMVILGNSYSSGDIAPTNPITTQWTPAQPNFTTP